MLHPTGTCLEARDSDAWVGTNGGRAVGAEGPVRVQARAGLDEEGNPIVKVDEAAADKEKKDESAEASAGVDESPPRFLSPAT